MVSMDPKVNSRPMMQSEKLTLETKIRHAIGNESFMLRTKYKARTADSIKLIKAAK